MANEIVDFDPNSLTLEEMCDVEDVTGMNLMEEFSKLDPEGLKTGEAKLPLRLMIALLWILKRRADPSFTYKDASQLRIDEIGAVFG